MKRISARFGSSLKDQHGCLAELIQFQIRQSRLLTIQTMPVDIKFNEQIKHTSFAKNCAFVRYNPVLHTNPRLQPHLASYDRSSPLAAAQTATDATSINLHQRVVANLVV